MLGGYGPYGYSEKLASSTSFYLATKTDEAFSLLLAKVGVGGNSTAGILIFAF